MCATYLIWSVRNADIKRWQFSLNNISKQNFEPLLHRRSLHTLCNFSCHARIDFDCDYFLCCFQNTDCQVTSSRTDFEDDIRRLEVGLLHNSFCNTRILQDMLAESGVELKDVVGLALGLLVWCRSGRAILLPFLNFAHGAMIVKYKSDDEVSRGVFNRNPRPELFVLIASVGGLSRRRGPTRLQRLST